jgi:hypothetical protein
VVVGASVVVTGASVVVVGGRVVVGGAKPPVCQNQIIKPTPARAATQRTVTTMAKV